MKGKSSGNAVIYCRRPFLGKQPFDRENFFSHSASNWEIQKANKTTSDMVCLLG